MNAKHILLIITGGIAAYKSLELIRRLQDKNVQVTPVMSKAAAQFVTPLSVSALAGKQVFTDLFDLTQEAQMGHIELSRAADLIVVAPASADFMAKMAAGLADDLASTLVLATDKDVMVAPAMNVRMWEHPATQRNIKMLKQDGVRFIGPEEGPMACGEYGAGRMADVPQIVESIVHYFGNGPLAGRRALVTSGPTHEPIDPVRYIANRSSGAQGTALAVMLRNLGADVHFITGPTNMPPPTGVQVTQIETAAQMADAVQAALPVDIAVCAAAVADWTAATPAQDKIKKSTPKQGFTLDLIQNPDILADVCSASNRPTLVIGFAAETQNLVENATQKRLKKGCDWMIANDVSPHTGIMGGQMNKITLIDENGAQTWPKMSKTQVADALGQRIAKVFET